MSAAMKIQDSGQITLTYDLFDLPSAQHKAGLVGLILLRDSLREREIGTPLDIETKGSVVSVTLSKESLGVLMRDAYEGFSIKSPKKKKVPKKARDQVTSDNGSQEKKERVFPKGTVIERLLHGGSNSPWLKLWREMIVGTLRIKPQSQKVYKEAERRQKLADELWDGLSKLNGDVAGTEIAGTLCFGAESTNAELVGFKNRADHKFLLHFWPLSAIVYVPRFLVRETQNGETAWKESLAISDKRRGPFFVVVVPDVMNIGEFPAAMKEYIQRLDDDRIFYRPAGAVVDLPEEAAIDFIFRMIRRRV